MAIISGANNGFGYRPDDHGSSTPAATPLAGTSVSQSGVIEKMSDVDWFTFDSTAGSANFTVSAILTGPTLDLRIELRDESGALLASADTATLGESLTFSLAGGTYYLGVASHGAYGDVGQYTLTGTVPPAPPPTPLATPADLTASAASSGSINLSWSDVSGETGYRIERSPDGTGGWTVVGTVGANVTAFLDAGLAADTVYHYQVFATAASSASSPSAIASARTWALGPPAAPSGLTASLVNSRTVRLDWSDNSSNETLFLVERSIGALNDWVMILTLGPDTTTATVGGLQKRLTYHFRVRAYNPAGYSAWSDVVSIYTASPGPQAADAPSWGAGSDDDEDLAEFPEELLELVGRDHPFLEIQ
jgi:hypothetical protein